MLPGQRRLARRQAPQSSAARWPAPISARLALLTVTSPAAFTDTTFWRLRRATRGAAAPARNVCPTKLCVFGWWREGQQISTQVRDSHSQQYLHYRV